MQAAQVGHLGDSRLRFVFGDTVLSFSLASDATYEDVARSLGAFKSVLWQSSPIDVTPGLATVIRFVGPILLNELSPFEGCSGAAARLDINSRMPISADDMRLQSGWRIRALGCLPSEGRL